MIKPIRVSATLSTLFTLSTLLLASATPAMADLVVLQYHHISDSTPSSTSTGVALFEDQLEMIEELELEVVPLEAGTRNALNGGADGDQRIAITFDDAYDSVYHAAKPLLEAKDYPYTVFVNTDAVGRKGYMTWDQLEEIRDNSGVTIANHSKDHNHLVQRPDESDQAWRDRVSVSLDKAQDALGQRLGVNTPLFAYPYGEFSESLEAMLSDRGWLGYGQQSGAIGRHSQDTRLPRFPMANAYGQLDSLKTKLTSRAMPVDAQQLGDAVMEENPPTLTFQLPQHMATSRLTCFASGQGRIDFRTASDGTIEVQAPSAFDSRRFRYNCTYPAGDGVFYWLSHQWLDLSQPED